jgi:hypothetical protein
MFVGTGLSKHACRNQLSGNEFRNRAQIASFSQRWAALNEVSAAVAAAVGTGALDCQHYTPVVRACRPPLTADLMAWITDIIETSLLTRQTNPKPVVVQLEGGGLYQGMPSGVPQKPPPMPALAAVDG